jgi:hypothetical protein
MLVSWTWIIIALLFLVLAKSIIFLLRQPKLGDHSTMAPNHPDNAKKLNYFVQQRRAYVWLFCNIIGIFIALIVSYSTKGMSWYYFWPYFDAIFIMWFVLGGFIIIFLSAGIYLFAVKRIPVWLAGGISFFIVVLLGIALEQSLGGSW